MNMSILRALPLLSILALAACESSEEAAKKAADAQREADKTVATIAQDTNAKEAEVRKKAAEDTARIASEGVAKIAVAENAADTKTTAASQALLTSRIDVRDTAAKRLESLDKSSVEVRTKLEKKLSKDEAAKVVLDLKSKSDAVRKAMADLDATTADSIDFVKKAIDTRLDDFDKALIAANKRV